MTRTDFQQEPIAPFPDMYAIEPWLEDKLSEEMAYPVSDGLYFHAITYLARAGLGTLTELTELTRTEIAYFALACMDQELFEAGVIPDFEVIEPQDGANG